MVVLATPDIAGCVIGHLLESSEITALCGTRISSNRKASWSLPAYAILVEPGRGGFPQDPPLEDERFDIRCYGPNDKSANDLWRLVNAYLLRHDRGPVAFRSATCAVANVEREGGPLRLTDGDGLWPYTLGSYHFLYSGVPLA
jgi:hypothetical protein